MHTHSHHLITSLFIFAILVLFAIITPLAQAEPPVYSCEATVDYLGHVASGHGESANESDARQIAAKEACKRICKEETGEQFVGCRKTCPHQRDISYKCTVGPTPQKVSASSGSNFLLPLKGPKKTNSMLLTRWYGGSGVSKTKNTKSHSLIVKERSSKKKPLIL